MFVARPLTYVLAATLLCFAATQAHASTPARFVEGEGSLESLLVFPDVQGDVTADVYCRAAVSPDGKLRRNYCFRSASVDEVFHDAIETAAQSARLIPAVVAGEPHRVFISYRVVFVRSGDRSLIRVFPNWARDTEEYGRDYIGPQRVSRLMRPDACITQNIRSVSSADSVRAGFDDISISLVATLTIDVNGEPLDDIAFESSSTVDDTRCRASVVDKMAEAEYIPAYHNGEPVEAAYVQTIGSREDMEFR